MGERAPYSRVYWSIVDDPKFERVFDDDHHLATWLRLLIAADAIWPASPSMPVSARRASVKTLSDVGLVDLQANHRYRIHGLDAERGRRKDAATTRGPSGNQTVPEPNPVSSPDGPSRTRDAILGSSSDVSSLLGSASAREGLPNIDPATVEVVERLTGRSILQGGAKQLTELDRLCQDHGGETVRGALERIASGHEHLTLRQLVWPAMKLLEPMPSSRDVELADRQAEQDKHNDRVFEGMLARRMESWRRGVWHEEWGPEPGAAA